MSFLCVSVVRNPALTLPAPSATIPALIISSRALPVHFSRLLFLFALIAFAPMPALSAVENTTPSTSLEETVRTEKILVLNEATTLSSTNSIPAPPAASPASGNTSADIILAPNINRTPAQNDLWQRIRNGFAMNELDSPLIARHEQWYADRPDYVARMTERSQRYLYFIVE